MKIYLVLLLLLISHSGKPQDCNYCIEKHEWTWPFVMLPEWPIKYIEIEKMDYPRNGHATFCKRPESMVDTIVLHHSETPTSDTPERINEYHLSRGSEADPWYMIGYSYIINSPYSGSTYPRSRVTEGRPMNIVGAHAGSNIYVPMDQDQKKMWEEGKIKCGTEGSEFRTDPNLVKDNKIRANVTTIGLVVVGNYAPFSEYNPGGYSPKNPRYPTEATLDMVARTSCQLQKKHPRIKNIKWHSFYHSTTCPGNLQTYLGRIKALTRKYGCEFS